MYPRWYNPGVESVTLVGIPWVLKVLHWWYTLGGTPLCYTRGVTPAVLYPGCTSCSVLITRVYLLFSVDNPGGTPVCAIPGCYSRLCYTRVFFLPVLITRCSSRSVLITRVLFSLPAIPGCSSCLLHPGCYSCSRTVNPGVVIPVPNC